MKYMFLRFSLLVVMVLSVHWAAGQTDKQTQTYEKTYVSDALVRPHSGTQQLLRNGSQWQDFESRFGDWWVVFDERTQLPKMAVGKPIALSGTSPVQSVWNFMNEDLSQFDLPMNELKLGNHYQRNGYTFIEFRQFHDDKKILWSEAQFQLNGNGDLVAFKLDVHPRIDLPENVGLQESKAGEKAVDGLENLTIHKVKVENDRYILPVPTGNNTYDYSVVQPVEVFATVGHKAPARFYTLVDVNSGEVKYREDRYHSSSPLPADITVMDSAIANPSEGGQMVALPYLRVDVEGATHYTDKNGKLSFPNLDQPKEATFFLEGNFAVVVDGSSDTTFYVKDTIYPGNNTIELNKAKRSEINGYYHTNVIHDHMKNYLTSDFTTLDVPFDVNVDIPGASCNAFFSGDAINFFAAGNGCPSAALFSDIIYHEYGHGINIFYYEHLGGNFSNSALGEGYSDVWAFSITEDPIVGKGFLGSPGSFVRRYDTNPKVYPQDLIGESHADGEIIAGAFWDLYLNLGSINQMTELFVGGHNGTPNAPAGMEGQLFTEVLIQVLFADDNDGNLANGTPNDSLIIDAFGKHGIHLLANVEIEHEPLVNTMDTVGNKLTANITTPLTAYLGDLMLHYKVLGQPGWNQAVMDHGLLDSYELTLPSMGKGDIVKYYFTINDVFGYSGSAQPKNVNAAGDANLPYFLMVGYHEILTEDFDNQEGNWKINPDGNDDALTGEWEIGSPNPSFSQGQIVQTGVDKTTSGNNFNRCAFTGNAGTAQQVGANDVDDGRTTLLSPALNLAPFEEPVISYWRWFVNDPPLAIPNPNSGNDPFQVFISNDGTHWKRVERTYVQDISWRQNVVRVSDYVDITSTVYLKFVAQDSILPGRPLNGGSIVEAAVDDLQVFSLNQATSGTEALILDQVVVYPLPANSVIRVENGSDIIGSVRLFDAAGRKVYHLENQYFPVSIPAVHLTEGLYVLEVETTKGTMSRKVVVQH